MIWIAFGVGLFVGTFVGIFTMGLCQMASRSRGAKDLSLEDYCRPEILHQPSFADSAK
jgi:uncharacterized membrane-anchored protein YhcB (DUF1043 family)